jgi:prepilin-type N-terminal cleavage/methylation domain-containing protein/prepilin-type processing-associated H-X9-DG protein
MARKQHGFTLIELLVVIAIIAILAAILFPVFAKAKESARQTKCLGHMGQLARAFVTYCNDYGGCLPTAARYNGWQSTDWVWTSGDYWWKKSTREVTKVVTNGSLFPYVMDMNVYTCPSDKLARVKRLSYSMNGYLVSGSGPEVGMSLDEIRKPSETILLTNEESTDDPRGMWWCRLNDGFYAYGSEFDVPQPIHNGGCIVAYCDGHVKWWERNALIAHADQFYPQ